MTKKEYDSARAVAVEEMEVEIDNGMLSIKVKLAGEVGWRSLVYGADVRQYMWRTWSSYKIEHSGMLP